MAVGRDCEPSLGDIASRLGAASITRSEHSDSYELADTQSDLRPAAVLALLSLRADAAANHADARWHVLLTERASHLRLHASECAFAGGTVDRRVDAGRPSRTALREASEEVGLHEASVRVLGVSPPFVTRHKFALYTVVAALADGASQSPLRCDPNEVARAFYVPLERFLSADQYFTVYSGRSPAFNVTLAADDTVTVFGLTAFICIILAMVVYDRMPEFELPAFFYGTDVKDEIGAATPQQVARRLYEHGMRLQFKNAYFRDTPRSTAKL